MILGGAVISVVVVTGSGGLVGSEVSRHFAKLGLEIVGIDNYMRKAFFGNKADTRIVANELKTSLNKYEHFDVDIRASETIDAIFRRYASSISLIVHAAAQPSHDWAARDPKLDFEINALGTLNLLESARNHCPNAVFVYMSTNKVYGDMPNQFKYVEKETRWEIDKELSYSKTGFNETLPIDNSLHSLFGVSKASGDLLVQEYGKYFGMKTVCLRGGCLSGPSHQGAELHGFLSYLVKCAFLGEKYTIFGYKGKQVRDNLHSKDLALAIEFIWRRPLIGEVFNIGGSNKSNISILEAIDYLNKSGYSLEYDFDPKARLGDHIWWISDIQKFKNSYPGWEVSYSSEQIIDETLVKLKDLH